MTTLKSPKTKKSFESFSKSSQKRKSETATAGPKPNIPKPKASKPQPARRLTNLQVSNLVPTEKITEESELIRLAHAQV